MLTTIQHDKKLCYIKSAMDSNKIEWQKMLHNLGCVLATLTMTGVLKTKTWSCAKTTWSSWPSWSWIWEFFTWFSVLHGHRSLMAGGKKVPIFTIIFMKTHACVCWVLGIRYKIDLNPSKNFKWLMVPFLLDVNIWFTSLKWCDVT